MATPDEPNPFLCGSCDAGLPMPCTCPEPDEVPEEPRGHDCDDPWSWNPIGEMCPRCGR